jgi:hypothetical protein
MITEPVQLAIIVGLPTTVATLVPVWVAILKSRSDREQRQEDRAQIAEVARQAAEAARLLVERQDAAASKADSVASKLVMNTAKVAESTRETNDKLLEVAKVTSVIHTLVNSQLTASKQSEFNAITRELALLHEVGGHNPSNRIIEAIKTAEANLQELAIILADRKSAADAVEAQQREQAKI